MNFDEPYAEILLQVGATLRQAQHVVVLTGAGVSAESGLPTFRDAQTGLWAQYRPEDLATPDAFRRNPRLVWQWSMQLAELAARSQPNPAHYALAELERRVPTCTLITQNVDGLHQRAGSTNVIELHGSSTRVRCFDEGLIVEDWAKAAEVPPRCPRCGGLLRPDVVWFGELIAPELLDAAQAAADACDLFLSVGTSGEVEPAASLPYRALRRGATLVVINLDVTTRATGSITTIHGRAGQVLPALVRAALPASDAPGM
jgi:NAD-dependent deacetylase